jgi:hypothetical protein
MLMIEYRRRDGIATLLENPEDRNEYYQIYHKNGFLSKKITLQIVHNIKYNKRCSIVLHNRLIPGNNSCTKKSRMIIEAQLLII